jgi:TetR/AcrR family transcriptional repressor of nem operon
MINQTTKSERTRSFIIEKSAEIFNKKGYAGTSMSDLVDATGLSKGGLYGNFENKEEIALAAFDYNCSRITESTKLLIDKAATVHEKLMVYAMVYKNISRDKMNRGGCPIMNTAVEADDSNFLLRDRAVKALHRWEKNIKNLIRQGIDEGEFRSDVNIRCSALSIIALIEGGVMISRTTGDRTAIDSISITVDSIITAMKN